MAKCTINHACGHTVVHDIVGPYKERDRQVAYEQERDCYPCYQARKAAARAAESAEATKRNAEIGLPALTGSPKQIAWAETIRSNGLAHLDAALATITSLHPTADTVERYIRLVRAARRRIAWLQSQTEARVIIDARYSMDSARQVLDRVQHAAKQLPTTLPRPLSQQVLAEMLADPQPAVREYALRQVGSAAA